MPGEVVETSFRAEEEGVYEGQSTQFSGTAYPAMRAWVRVVSLDEYEHTSPTWARTSVPPRRRSGGGRDSGGRGGRVRMTPPTIADRRPRSSPAASCPPAGLDRGRDERRPQGRRQALDGHRDDVFGRRGRPVRADPLQLIVPDSTIMKPEIFNRILSATSVTTVVLFAAAFPDRADSTSSRYRSAPAASRCLAYISSPTGSTRPARSCSTRASSTQCPRPRSPLPPLSDEVFSPSHGVDAWIGGIGLATLGFVCYAISTFATLANMRAPGWPGAGRRSSPGRLRAVSGVLLVVGRRCWRPS